MVDLAEARATTMRFHHSPVICHGKKESSVFKIRGQELDLLAVVTRKRPLGVSRAKKIIKGTHG